MSRWEPNARARLTEVAMELFKERGFDHTTVAEIAARAGLTERTFFRYFSDKREVLFWGAAALQELLTSAVAGAPESASPLDAVTLALEGVAPGFEERRVFARQRMALIDAHRELKERELIKLASLASAIAATLHRRGIPEPTASLVAEAGIAIFKVAFERWLSDPKRKDFTHHIRASRRALEAVTATGKTASKRKAR